ncbi:MAG TPA: methionyl-tRNA formyltransferase [Pyrinomonadaceae bacterium]|nr:methionyl-tRNA formyltransferase [Pyrinomonadaceae bacterium]
MKIAFMGTPHAAVASLDALLRAGHEIAAVYTQPDRPSGRGKKISASPVKEYALERGLHLEQPQGLRNMEAIEKFRGLRADAAVVVAYGRILPQDFLTAFPLGAINLHFSLLPKYRGAAPVNWALANGETLTGVTTMLMDEGLDTGPILLQEKVEIGWRETAPHLVDRLSAIGADLLIRTLAEVDQIEPMSQCNDDASYAPILRKADGLINWERPASDICNRVRGFQPYPGSFSYLNGVRAVIWSARPSEERADMPTVPGTILSKSDGVIEVAAGEGTVLRIEELQFEGKRRKSATDALNSGQIQVGLRFSGVV